MLVCFEVIIHPIANAIFILLFFSCSTRRITTLLALIMRTQLPIWLPIPFVSFQIFSDIFLSSAKSFASKRNNLRWHCVLEYSNHNICTIFVCVPAFQSTESRINHSHWAKSFFCQHSFCLRIQSINNYCNKQQQQVNEESNIVVNTPTKPYT